MTLKANPIKEVIPIFEQKKIRDVVDRIINFITYDPNSLRDVLGIDEIHKALFLL